MVIHTRRGFDILAFAFLPSEHVLQSPVAFDTQDGEATVLAGLSHAEEDGPKDALRCCADGQTHLGKGENIAGNAAEQDDNSCAERQRLQPRLDAATDAQEEFFHH